MLQHGYKYDAVSVRHRKQRATHWDAIAKRKVAVHGPSAYYHSRLADIYQSITSGYAKILEIGMGPGDLLANLRPEFGVGVDISAGMVAKAKTRHPELHFVHADGHHLPLEGNFDLIILSDLLNDVWDVQGILTEVSRLSSPTTRVVVNFYSRLWQLPLNIAQALGFAKQMAEQNWLTKEDITNLMALTDLEVFRSFPEILLPLNIPLLSPLLNRFLVKFPPFSWFALTDFIVACPVPITADQEQDGAVSVIIPARNEAGNIDRLFDRIPNMGASTELIFIEGHSKDNTFEAIERAIQAHPDKNCQLVRQTGKGKGDAVRLGFDLAKGNVLMILDSDLSVSPDDLPRFYRAIVEGKGELINGVRLVYPMENLAMRPMNFIGNKFFSLAFSWLFGQPIKDTLCGTKVLSRAAYDKIKANRANFGDFDPYGDFDLLFGAARLSLKITDMPVRYRSRTYGAPNISRWRDGWLLLRMILFAAAKIKFI
jgi:2-polyprenyl-3-methyl-5-hydroxy-6-metoxy-1,4-benzoquinol methylase